MRKEKPFYRSASGIVIILLAVLGTIFLRYQFGLLRAEPAKQISQMVGAIQKKKDQARMVIDSLLKEQGTIYLYTNDPDAQAIWIPEYDRVGVEYGISGTVLDLVDFENFIKKRDSLGFQILLKTGNREVYRVKQSLVYNQLQTEKRLWFFCRDTENGISNDTSGGGSKSPVKEQFVSSWGLGLGKMNNLKNELSNNANLIGTIPFLREVKGFHFYMISYDLDNQKQNLSLSEFNQSVRGLNALFKSERIDTTLFQVKEINQFSVADHPIVTK
ncbi:hypothetical protein [Pedobacter caeni]|uniref:Uncharacterized protein n=1 Tax=Pedobacter caeni TaxID=288992 RepID=A0A1M4TVX3_9SPHI|nr:hypothetical protein [Pedobacter caeni]SHE48621.1 hypothetical protein SAMN04488522_101340 [Pedobacter caeni]